MAKINGSHAPMDSKVNRYNNDVIRKDVNLKEKYSYLVPFYYNR
jgi:hypothetical protein